MADNPEAVAIVDRHWLLISARWQRGRPRAGALRGVVSDHRNLLRAMARRDMEAAGTLMGAHVIKAKFDRLERMAALQSSRGRVRRAS